MEAKHKSWEDFVKILKTTNKENRKLFYKKLKTIKKCKEKQSITVKSKDVYS